MIIGQTLFVASTGGPYLSPYIPRGGNAAQITCDLIGYWGGITSFDIEIQTKNSEQDDAVIAANPAVHVLGTLPVIAGGGGTIGLNTGSFGGLLSGGTAGFLELVRFEYQLVGPVGAGVHFRMLIPSWLTNGA
ncbi:MAG: hypothetical protein ACE5F1_07555 [Planctomycetota bacterium]